MTKIILKRYYLDNDDMMNNNILETIDTSKKFAENQIRIFTDLLKDCITVLISMYPEHKLEIIIV